MGGKHVLEWFILSAAASGPTTVTGSDMNNVPMDHRPVTHDILVPISDSVRAATWDDLKSKPVTPVQLRVACIVFMPFGAPGSCVLASHLTAGQPTVDWARLRDEEARAHQFESQADLAVLEVAEARILTLRLAGENSRKPSFVIRIFDEIVSPADARHSNVTGDPLSLNDVTLQKPIDLGLVKTLYPPAALRYSASARVAVQCRIEEAGNLLCRDPGVIQIEGGGTSEISKSLQLSFRFATYQLASTLRINPKSKAGVNVTGRNLRLAITWTLP